MEKNEIKRLIEFFIIEPFKIAYLEWQEIIGWVKGKKIEIDWKELKIKAMKKNNG